jgi:hypothetical protein
MEKLTIDGSFSIAMLNYQRVYHYMSLIPPPNERFWLNQKQRSSCGDPLMAEALAGLSQLFGGRGTPGGTRLRHGRRLESYDRDWKSTWMLGCIHYNIV